MLATTQAAERISRLAAYREQVLSSAPEISRHDFGPHGVFMGYDFHVTPEGPKLIEINTNAGGAFLNAALLNAQRACCKEVNDHFLLPIGEGFETVFAAMFRNEWQLQGRTAPLRTIGIVDDAPEQQYLFPEFILAKGMLERHGFEVHICDPAELTFSEGALRSDDRTIDLVYNRLLDFTFDKLEHDVLRQAYAEGAVVVTPGPHHHALLANKGNLIMLSDPELLRRMGKAAFNPTHPGEPGNPLGWWVSPWHFGLNEGPIVLMIENYRSELLWRLMRGCSYIQQGLRRAGFTGGWLAEKGKGSRGGPNSG